MNNIETSEINQFLEKKYCLSEYIVSDISKICKNSFYGIYTVLTTAIYITFNGMLKSKDFFIDVALGDNKDSLIGIERLGIDIEDEITFKECLIKVKQHLFEKGKSAVSDDKKSDTVVLTKQVYSNHREELLKYKLLFILDISTKKIEIKIKYNEEMFSEEYIQSILEIFNELFGSFTRNWDIYIKDLNSITSKSRFEFYEQLNNTWLDFKSDENICEYFHHVSVANSENIAIVCNQESITYNDLDKMSSMLAETIRKSNVGKNDLVGILCGRSIELFVSILATLKAGAAYVPIDRIYPEDRIKYILNDSKTSIILTDDINLQLDENIKVVNVKDKKNYTTRLNDGEVVRSGEDLAYVIYTSGSTGNPKGVMVQHKAVINFIDGMNSIIDIRPNTKVLNVTTVSFDIFGYEALAPLLAGATIIVADEECQNDSKKIQNLIQEFDIDIMQTTPSRMGIILNDNQKGYGLSKLKNIVIGGEVFQEKVFHMLKKITDAKIYNFYGPTEATIWATYKEIEEHEKINIGKPMPNYEIFIVDEEDRLMEMGNKGEICIAGKSLAQGYLNNEKLTSEKFIDFIDHNKQRKLIYRTGDTGRISYNGEIECIGRIDNQIKLNGYRIELGEVENACLKCYGIKDVAAVCMNSEKQGAILIAYYTSNKKIETKTIKEVMEKFVPKYMIPQHFIEIKEMPLNANGKIDRNELKKFDYKVFISKRSENKLFTSKTNTVTENEKIVMNIWREVLDAEHISVEDNFFDIGGNSLLLLKIHSKIDEIFPDEISVIQIFDNPTIREIAQVLKGKRNFEEFDLRSISLSDDYFRITSPNNYELFEYEMSGNKLNKLCEMNSEFNIEMMDIFAGMFNYCFHEITEEDSITIHYINKKSHIKMISLDYSKIKDIDEIFKGVSHLNSKAFNDFNNNLKEYIHDFRYEEGKITPLIMDGDLENYEGHEIYDLVMRVTTKEDRIKLLLDFNEDRLNKNKIREIFNIYINLIEILIENKL